MKALRTAVIVVGAAALIASGIGAAAGAGLIGTTTLSGTVGALGAAGITSGSAVLGLSAATWTAIGAIGGVVAALGGGLLQSKPSFSAAGSGLDFTTNPQSGLPYAIGRTRMSGLKSAGKTGNSPGWSDSQDLVFFAVLLSIAGPVQAIETFKADNVATSFDGSGNAIGSEANWMGQKVYLGAPSQSTALSLSLNGTSFPGWTSAHKLSGMAHALWALRHDSDGTHFSGGVPEPSWVGRWVRVYDPRKDGTYPGGSGAHRSNNEATWEWSRNPALHALTWAIGRHQNGKRIAGIGAPIANIRVADFVEAANVADTNGWGCGGVEWTTDSKWDILKRMLQAGGAVPTQTGAMIGCRVRTPRVSIGTIPESDFLDGITYTATKGRRNRFNTVIPRFVSEAHNWQVVPGSEVSVPAFVTEDGGKRTKGLDFPLVQDEIGQTGYDGKLQAGQLAAYEIVDSREAGIEFTTKPRWINLRTGDCVTLNAPQDGIVNLKVVITARAVDPATMTIRFSAETETDSKHAFALGKTTTPPPAPTLTVPPAGPSVPSPADWDVVPFVEPNGQRGLRLTGTITDPIADAVRVAYRASGATDWIEATTLSGRGALSYEIWPLPAGTEWDIRLIYVAGSRAGDALEINDLLIGADTNLIGSGGVTVSGNSVTKVSGSIFNDAYAYTDESHSTGAYASVIVNSLSGSFIFGLTTTAPGGYASMEYGIWKYSGSATLNTMESGSNAYLDSYAIGDKLEVRYESGPGTIKYYRNGTVILTRTGVPSGLDMHFITFLQSVGTAVTGIEFGAINADGELVPDRFGLAVTIIQNSRKADGSFLGARQTKTKLYRYHGNLDVSAVTSWAVDTGISQSLAASVDSTGLVSLQFQTGRDNFGIVRSTYDGVIFEHILATESSWGDPEAKTGRVTTRGPGFGASNIAAVELSMSSVFMGRTGATGAISVSAYFGFHAEEANTGTFGLTLTVNLYRRPVGGSWTLAASNTTANAQPYYPIYSMPELSALIANFTGLAANNDYEFFLSVQRASGTARATLLGRSLWSEGS